MVRLSLTANDWCQKEIKPGKSGNPPHKPEVLLLSCQRRKIIRKHFESKKMKVLLTLVFACLLAGCTKSDTKSQTPAKSSDGHPLYSTPEGRVCSSQEALWLITCTHELYNRQGRPLLNNGMIFTPQTDPAEEIFQKCISVKPLPFYKVANYKKWLKDRVSEIQNITPGATRRYANKILRQEGGIFQPDSIRYVHKDCEVLKVRIRFELISNENGFKRGPLNEDDIVQHVSMPSLGFCYCN
jgi:hypothetical protein